ncbi:LOW QUALITY PROTEIN: uncharacterized protein Dere_GG26411 [Drosophila erecta]|uniref:Uncharacterized protein n=1 Tax=Drosophila erecta TaxID=7220 RepID=A0A0Q5VYP5_DROER|nr:LOW QUALITY PROTEIN: uncharacterized protein Dere_GG26411 [Drosophila erecta]
MILITGCTHELTSASPKPQSVEHIRKLFSLVFEFYLKRMAGRLIHRDIVNYANVSFTELRLAVISRKAADSCRSNKHFQFPSDARCAPLWAENSRGGVRRWKGVSSKLGSGAASIPSRNKVMWPG